MSSQVQDLEPSHSLVRRIGWLGLLLFGPWVFCLLSAFSSSDAERALLFSPHSPFGFLLPAVGNVAALTSAVVFLFKGPYRLGILAAASVFLGLAAVLAHPFAAALVKGFSPLYAHEAPSLYWLIVFPFSLLSGPFPH